MKKEIEQYYGLKKEAEELERGIEAYRKKRENVPVIHDKVQSSQKEWPYIPIHLDVEAYEPKALAAIDKKIRNLQERWCAKCQELYKVMDEIDLQIEQIPDARTRAIVRARVIRNVPQKDLAIEYDLTEARISQIVKEATEK